MSTCTRPEGRKRYLLVAASAEGRPAPAGVYTSMRRAHEALARLSTGKTRPVVVPFRMDRDYPRGMVPDEIINDK